MKVLVLGCGPAGLLATLAAEQTPGTSVVIASKNQKSELHGCQYLHEPIDGLGYMRGERNIVDYQLLGTVEGYTKKVYGPYIPPVAASPQLYHGPRPAWNLRTAYELLWQRYQELIVHTDLQPGNIAEVLRYYNADVVISSVPAPVLCQRGSEHSFDSIRCWAVGDAPEIGQKVPFTCDPFTVVCDGTTERGWYRVSNVFDRSTIEWPGHARIPPIEGVVAFTKPLTTTCDCWPEIKRVGRYGQWRKGILSHHAFADSVNYLARGGDTERGPLSWRS